MSFRTWMSAVAVGLVISAGQVCGQIAPKNEPRQEERTANTNENSDDQYSNTFGLLSAFENIKSAIRDLVAEEDKTSTERQKDREDRDLKAQESMAKWAELMFYAAVATVVLTLVALFAIIRTLHHTRRAADYTRDMLGEAKRTTSAMSRAWIKVGIVVDNREEIIKDGQGATYFNVRIKVENIGNSPAFEVHSTLYTTDEILKTYDVVSTFAKEAVENHLMSGKDTGVSLFPASQYFRHWGASFDTVGNYNRLIVAVVCYKTIYDQEIHQTAFVCGVGWNGMGNPPKNIETATFDWAGGFAT